MTHYNSCQLLQFAGVLGGLIAAAGIFLPGTFMIFFVIRFWEKLKKYRMVKASLEGINAASSGLVIAAAFLLFQPIESNANVVNITILVGTFILLMFTKNTGPVNYYCWIDRWIYFLGSCQRLNVV